MPNVLGSITGVNGAFQGSTPSANGALLVDNVQNKGGLYGSNNQTYNIGLDASRSNNIFGNADTVQPPAIVLIPQIKF